MEAAFSTRYGGDIFAAGEIKQDGKGRIIDTFEDATVFLTGGTGFLGKMFLEKLLRVCPKVKKIYLLLRPKRGKDEAQRFEEIFNGPNMAPMKYENPGYMKKVVMIRGDCACLDLGIDEEDKLKILDEVNYIIHCAATVRFDEKLKLATHINVRAVRDLVAMAKKIKNLKSFLHVSTAFSHCPRQDIDEIFYKPVLSGDKLIQLVDMLDDEKLIDITPGLQGEYPNSYAFTKAIAEDMIKAKGKDLPVAVLRPSIVIASVKEPVEGWVDNMYGATGICVAGYLGFLRAFRGKKEYIAEMIPADYVINAGLAVLWRTAIENSVNYKEKSEPIQEGKLEKREIPIYNVVSSVESPLTWGETLNKGRKYVSRLPSVHQVWHIQFYLTPNKYWYMISAFLIHTIPAYLFDFILVCIGKKPMMVKGYQKLHKFAKVVTYFALRTWTFKNDNTQKLWQSLDNEDQELFPFSMKNFDWDHYFWIYQKGARVYLLKDPLSTTPVARLKYWILFIVHYILMAVLLFLFYKLLSLLWVCIF